MQFLLKPTSPTETPAGRKPLGVAILLLLLCLAPALAQEGTRVQNPLTTPQQNGAMRVSWDAPSSAEGIAVYTIRYSDDLEEWTEVEDPEILFENQRAYWIDSAPIDSRFYRVWEQLPIDLARITRLEGEGEIPLAVRYAPELEPFEASEETEDRARARFELSEEQGLEYVLGMYIVTFADGQFPFAIDRTGSDSDMLVTEDGLPMQQLAADLLESEGGELLQVHEGNFKGFTAYLPPDLVDQLQASPLIKIVEGEPMGERLED